MKNQEINNRINLKALIIESLTKKDLRVYGAESINFHGEHHKANRAIFAYRLLLPVLKQNEILKN